MEKLKGSQRKYLRGLAHSLKPVVLIGKQGLAGSVVAAINEALDAHELIKVRFIDFKEREEKEEISSEIEAATTSSCVGMIGHHSIFYRQHRDPKKRKITLP
mgnify:CR=1 FL=1